MEQGTEWLCKWWQWSYSFLILQWLNSLHSLFYVLYWPCCSAHIHKRKFYFLGSFPLKEWTLYVQFIQLLSHVQLFAIPRTASCQASLSITNYHSLLKLMSIKLMTIESVMPPISSSVVPFSSCLQSFLASGSFPRSQLFASGGQSIRVSALASVLPMNIQDWFPLVLTGLISLQSKGLSRVFSNTTVQKHQFLSTQSSLWSNYHIHMWLLEKPWLWLYRSLAAEWRLCFLICCLGLS